MKLNRCFLVLAGFTTLAVLTACGPQAENVEEIKVTPTGAGGGAAGTDQAGGGDFAAGGNAVTPGKEDAPTPGAPTNTPGNEMPAGAL